MTLAGGGSRARKRQRRLPSTAAEIDAARRALLDKKHPHAAHAAFLKREHPELYRDMRKKGAFRKGTVFSWEGHKTPIVRGSIVKGRNGKCVFWAVRDPRPKNPKKPFTTMSMCHGGAFVTGHFDHATAAEAKAAAKRRAER